MECSTEPETGAFDTRTYAGEYPYGVSRFDVQAGSVPQLVDVKGVGAPAVAGQVGHGHLEVEVA